MITKDFGTLKTIASQLGIDMAKKGFSVEQNPYLGVCVPLAKAWHEGYWVVTVIEAVSRKMEECDV